MSKAEIMKPSEIAKWKRDTRRIIKVEREPTVIYLKWAVCDEHKYRSNQLQWLIQCKLAHIFFIV